MTTIQRKRRFGSLFGSESTNESDLVNSNLEYPKLVLCHHHHANWALLDRRVQALYIRSLQLCKISSSAEHMSRVERAPSIRERATVFQPHKAQGGSPESASQPKEEQPGSTYPRLRPGVHTA